ncbi:nuclear transport factor 2 family protein [Rivularia sp. UHCC 0363]|uniref:nuclear transport factor 2 family protein n=1 Tax=Rivularia sp. UHCC 0363 TaxID=3110244 RepID=UPI002B20322E|nr:nuclear transport factor 2 family protein [Rivularia sp. UHCC 0363]MEA5594205.1 nuclear transport factor 2 family protein [Rivularia sp. UHCC 0363]
MSLSEQQAIEQELLELDKTFLDAILNHDVALVERILPSDFLSVFPNGRLADKAAELDNVRTVELESYSTDEVQVHWYANNVAIINFRLSLKMNNQDIKQVRDSHVYLKRDGGWQMIMGQTTPILS